MSIESKELLKMRSLSAISGGALTNSKRPECFVEGVYPTHLKRAKGCFVYDTENNQYIDFICGLGTNLLGYAHNKLNLVTRDEIENGTLFSLGSELEVKAAEKLKDLFPFADKIRFLMTGSEACNASIRIARAHHGVSFKNNDRALVLTDGYHGWGDNFIGILEPRYGIMPDSFFKPLKGNEHLIRIAAAVIIEPIITDISDKRIEYLRELRRETSAHGTILIFDEIITGFRFPKFSVSNYFEINPDILLLGKCIGGGHPLSAVCIAKSIGTNVDWFVSSTWAGYTLAMRGLIETIDLLKNELDIMSLWRSGMSFMSSFNELMPERIKLEGYPTRGVFVAENYFKSLFFQECVKAGLLFGNSFFINFKHLDHFESILSLLKDITYRLEHEKIELEGKEIKSPLAQTLRNSK